MKEYKKIRVIEIEWNNITLESLNFHEKGNTLYQAYGDSPIYGRDSLLYVGKTVREFEKRHKEHMMSKLSRVNNSRYLVGKVSGLDASIELNHIEGLLITMLKPSYNSANINDIDKALKKKGEIVLVLNKGNRGIIPLEVTNIWWQEEI